MAKKFNYKPLIEYTDYAERKYIKPEKAGDLKEDMELFRKNLEYLKMRKLKKWEFRWK